MSVATWNYLNPFFSPEHDDSTLWTEDYTYVDHDDDDDDEEDYTYYTLGDNEDDTMATGAYTLESRLARALPLRPNTTAAAVPRKIIQRHKKKQRIVLEARKAVPAAIRPKTTRAPDAPAATTTTTAVVPNFLQDWLNSSSCRPKPDPSAGRTNGPTYASRFTGHGLPQAPSQDYEDESQLMATFDLPRPPSLVYKYKVVVDP